MSLSFLFKIILVSFYILSYLLDCSLFFVNVFFPNKAFRTHIRAIKLAVQVACLQDGITHLRRCDMFTRSTFWPQGCLSESHVSTRDSQSLCFGAKAKVTSSLYFFLCYPGSFLGSASLAECYAPSLM